MIVRHARLWWFDNGPSATGCLLTLGSTSLMLLAVLIFLWPFGRSTIATGQVVGFGMRETDEGSYQVAYILADGVRNPVRLYPSDRCAVGDEADVRVVARLWGKSVSRAVAGQLCPPQAGGPLDAE